MQSVYVTTKIVQCNVSWLKFFINIKYTRTGLMCTAIKALKYVLDQMTSVDTESLLSNIFPCLNWRFHLFFLLEDWYCKIQRSLGWDLFNGYSENHVGVHWGLSLRLGGTLKLVQFVNRSCSEHLGWHKDSPAGHQKGSCLTVIPSNRLSDTRGGSDSLQSIIQVAC